MAKTSFPPVGIDRDISYDPDTGIFRWRIATHGKNGAIHPGDIVGCPKDGYIQIGWAGRMFRAHRVAWYMMTGVWLPSSQDIDHDNRVRSDNRWKNLKLATRSENCHNKTRDYGGRSGVNGVHWAGDRKQKWEARITIDRKLHILGQFDNFSEAVAARRAAELRFLGRNEVPDHLVPISPLVEPTRRPKLGMTAEGHARLVAARRKPRNSAGRYPGVRMNAGKDRWIAMIGVGGKHLYLGTHLTYEEAVAARKAAEAQHHC